MYMFVLRDIDVCIVMSSYLEIGAIKVFFSKERNEMCSKLRLH